MGTRAAKRTEGREAPREIWLALADADPREYGYRAADGTEWVHVPWCGWTRQSAMPPYLLPDGDCRHGCNGSPCGSEACTFICH